MDDVKIAAFFEFNGMEWFASQCVAPVTSEIGADLRAMPGYGDPGDFALPAKFVLKSSTSEPTASIGHVIDPEQLYKVTLFIAGSLVTWGLPVAYDVFFKKTVRGWLKSFKERVVGIVGEQAWRGTKPAHIQYLSDVRPVRLVFSAYFSAERLMVIVDHRSSEKAGFAEVDVVVTDAFDRARAWAAAHAERKPFLYYKVIDGRVLGEPVNLESAPV